MQPAAARAADDTSRFEPQLTPILESAVRERHLPGLALAVVAGGKMVYARGFGVKSVDAPDEKVSPESLFHMASVTKTFVATSVMQLAEQGKVDLDAPVITYLPYFKLNDARFRTITVRQLLTHSSGMPDVVDYEWHKPQYDGGALERYVRGLSNHSLIAAPGARTRYSNMAYEVLGDLIAKVSGEEFEDYVARHILRPLGMKHSTLLLKEADPALLVRPHRLNSSGELSVSPVFPYNRIHAPSSTLYSNVVDMARFAIANLQRGELDGTRILKVDTIEAMWAPSRGGEVPNIGICWFLGKYRDHQKVSHSGGDVGFRSNLVLLPQQNIGVVLMTNCDRASLGPLTDAALDVALGIEPKRPAHGSK
ncbi:MAG: serine hydrolase domain-containing protein [Pirellulales bacterium]